MHDAELARLGREIAEQPCTGSSRVGNLACAQDPRVVQACWPCRARALLKGQPALPKGWYCSTCGTRHEDAAPAKWPYTCDLCHTEHYNSPKPVVALVLTAWSPEGHKGYITIQRGIEPHRGKWAFPGGYIDHAEDWRHAAAREAREELGIALDPRFLTLWEEHNPVVTKTNFLVLFVGYSGDVLLPKDFKLQPPDENGHREVLQVEVRNDPNFDLGVPSHNVLWKTLRHL